MGTCTDNGDIIAEREEGVGGVVFGVVGDGERSCSDLRCFITPKLLDNEVH
jgi:hypothetical protein